MVKCNCCTEGGKTGFAYIACSCSCHGEPTENPKTIIELLKTFITKLEQMENKLSKLEQTRRILPTEEVFAELWENEYDERWDNY